MLSMETLESLRRDYDGWMAVVREVRSAFDAGKGQDYLEEETIRKYEEQSFLDFALKSVEDAIVLGEDYWMMLEVEVGDDACE
mgnify:CR=1 FL=1|tara:strand:- start:117 stop:365 length:249 start_codon:yes stop_codon:yes gene_type:complete